MGWFQASYIMARITKPIVGHRFLSTSSPSFRAAPFAGFRPLLLTCVGCDMEAFIIARSNRIIILRASASTFLIFSSDVLYVYTYHHISICDDDCAVYSIPLCVHWPVSRHPNQQLLVFSSLLKLWSEHPTRAVSRPYLHRARARFFHTRDPWCKGLMGELVPEDSIGLTFWMVFDTNLGTSRSQTRKVSWTSIFDPAFPPRASHRHSIHREASLNPAPTLASSLWLQWL